MEDMFVGKLIKEIGTALDNHRNRFFEKYNLTSSQIDALIFIFINSKNIINQKDIEKFLRLKNPTVTGILSRLEKKGFIKRSVSITDKRHKEMILTQKSKNMREKVFQDMKKDMDTLLSNMSENEKESLKYLLSKLLENIPE